MNDKFTLKPCPFCGGTDIQIRSNGIGDYYCICGDATGEGDEVACGARTDDAHCETQQGAVDRWNRRAREEILEARLKQYGRLGPPTPARREDGRNMERG